MRVITHYACRLCGREISTKRYLKRGWTTTEGEYHLACRNFDHHPRSAVGIGIEGEFKAVGIDTIPVPTGRRALQV